MSASILYMLTLADSVAERVLRYPPESTPPQLRSAIEQFRPRMRCQSSPDWALRCSRDLMQVINNGVEWTTNGLPSHEAADLEEYFRLTNDVADWTSPTALEELHQLQLTWGITPEQLIVQATAPDMGDFPSGR